MTIKYRATTTGRDGLAEPVELQRRVAASLLDVATDPEQSKSAIVSLHSLKKPYRVVLTGGVISGILMSGASPPMRPVSPMMP